MTDLAAIRDLWNQRAALGETAGTQDLILKELEQRAILREVQKRQPRTILEVGCGTGELSRLIVRECPSVKTYVAVDYAEAMIQAARDVYWALDQRFEWNGWITYLRADYTGLPTGSAQKPFDMVITERMVINVPADDQERCVDYLLERVADGGTLLLCEHSYDGLMELNHVRAAWGLPFIDPPWHNDYLHRHFLYGSTVVPIAGAYYVLSRLVNAKIAQLRGHLPRYDSWVNRLALRCPEWLNRWCGKWSQARLWILEKA